VFEKKAFVDYSNIFSPTHAEMFAVQYRFAEFVFNSENENFLFDIYRYNQQEQKNTDRNQ